MAMIETHRSVVYPWHCDHMGHMNVMWYAGKFDEATWALFHAIGLTPASCPLQQTDIDQAAALRIETST